MPGITDRASFLAAARQDVRFQKSGLTGQLTTQWSSMFAQTGDPAPGSLTASNTANGVVPVAGDPGFPTIVGFAAGALGYLSISDFAGSGACRARVADCLFRAGSYNFNDSIALASQPSYSSRLPGTDYAQAQIWIEIATAFTGIPTFSVTYTNQAGVAGQVSTNSMTAAPAAGRMMPMPFAAGDSGVQKIESVTATVATVGTFNVLVLRPLWTGRIQTASGDLHNFASTGLPRVFDTSALYFMAAPDTGNTGNPEAVIQIASV